MSNRRYESRGGDDGHRQQDGWGLFATLSTITGHGNQVQAMLEHASVTTVQFGLSHLTLSTPAMRYKCNPVAYVSFKLAGQTINRKISVVDGCMISGVADTFEVKFADESQTLVGLDQEYWMTAQATPGTRPTTSAPPLYYPIITRGAFSYAGMVTIEAGGIQDILVPRDIGVTSAKVQAWPAAAAIVPIARGELVAQFFSSLSLFGGWDAYYDGGNWQPVNPAVDSFTLFNFSSGPVNYLVAFGIDG